MKAILTMMDIHMIVVLFRIIEGVLMSEEKRLDEKIRKYCLGECSLGTLRSDGKIECSSYAGICLYGIMKSLDPIG